MDHYRIFHHNIPPFLQACAQVPAVQRLQKIGMNCGCEYTSFSRFRSLAPYSRYDHSLGVALIVWHFTGNQAQAIAGLLHDIATPVFAHVVDFLRGDYLQQESTEAGTEDIINRSAQAQALLSRLNLRTGDVCDYHRYPIADNVSPLLSADRLEYTLGNCINYGIRTADEILAYYDDLTVGTNEYGHQELVFKSPDIARSFADAALQCSRIYVADEDRYSMQILAELLHSALEYGVICESDLYTTEPQVISRLLADMRTASDWRSFCKLELMLRSETAGSASTWRKVFAKKRYIDPFVQGFGRLSSCSPDFKESLRQYLDCSQDYWICARAR